MVMAVAVVPVEVVSADRAFGSVRTEPSVSLLVIKHLGQEFEVFVLEVEVSVLASTVVSEVSASSLEWSLSFVVLLPLELLGMFKLDS